MRDVIVALASGVTFGGGLALAGMTNPAKVLGFLDVAGDWDPGRFLATHWQREPCLVRQAFPGFEAPIDGITLVQAFVA